MAMTKQFGDEFAYEEPRGECPRCRASQVRHLVIGLPAGPEGPESSPPWVDWVGCVHPGHDRECESCGHRWTAEVDEDRPRGLLLELGQKVEIKGRTLKVSELDISALPKVRSFLIEVARGGVTVTYGDVVAATGISHPPRGLGRLMDLISEDCSLRNEPSLAALAVNQTTHEVGGAFTGDAAGARDDVYAYWAHAPLFQHADGVMVSTREIPIPDQVVWDLDLGLTLNLPAEYQLETGWWLRDRERYEALLKAREQLGITCLDFADSRFMPGDDNCA